MPHSLRTIHPEQISIVDVKVLARTVHSDPRGYLLETMRSDDKVVDGSHFAMSYTSLTIPGEKRDVDRWHVHKDQEDRFVVLSGEMILALFDGRPDSRSSGTLNAIRMLGAVSAGSEYTSATYSKETFMVTIPRGVYHCIGNLGHEPFLLQNYPTSLYNPADEGRVPFSTVPVKALDGQPFGWDKVEVVR